MSDVPVSIEPIDNAEPSESELPKFGPGRQVDEETENKIATMRLAGIPTRAIAQECGVSNGAVTKVFRRWLRTHAEEALGDPRQLALEVVSRLWQNANNARSDYIKADEAKDRTALLNTERAAIMDIAKLVGIDVTRIQITKDQDHDVDEALRKVMQALAINAESQEQADGD